MSSNSLRMCRSTGDHTTSARSPAMRRSSGLLPLDRQRAFQAVDLKVVPSFLVDFYRHFCRQSVRHQRWRGFAGDSAKSDLSRSIEVYRLRRRLPTASTCVHGSRGSAREGSASNAATHCLDSLFRPVFYRQDATWAAQLRVSIDIHRLAQLSATDLAKPDRPANRQEWLATALSRLAALTLLRNSRANDLKRLPGSETRLPLRPA